MSFQTDLENPAVEKNSLVILKPKYRVTGWTDLGSDLYRASFTLGRVSRVFITTSLELTADAASPTVDQHYWYDETNNYVYAKLTSGNGPDDPTDATYTTAYGSTVAGLTVEFEIYTATREFYGPSDPLDASSTAVLWKAVLKQAPRTSYGSRQALFGFNPLNQANVTIENKDGWMLPFLYDCSFSLAAVRCYVVVGVDLEYSASFSKVKEFFRGYLGSPSLSSDNVVSLPCYDFLALLDRPAYPTTRMSTTEFPSADPSSVKPGQEWWIRRVRGMVDNHVPINIDFSDTPSTSNNRDWLTHEAEGTVGAITLAIDDAAANTTTETFFTTTPKLNPGDAIWFNHQLPSNPTLKYTIVDSVDYVTKKITHSAITRTISAGDGAFRYSVGWVKVQDSDDNWWNLFPQRNFLYMNNATLGNNPEWQGFRLADDWEADIGFPETFDPTKHRILCRVYGTVTLDNYADGSTAVGAVVNEGGIAAQSVSTLHYLLREAGIPNAMIDQTTFAAAATNHELGIAWPRTAAESTVPTYKDLIQLVLQSMLWKLYYLTDAVSREVFIGLVETGPFAGSADYDTDDKDFGQFAFEHDYSALASQVRLDYAAKEEVRDGDNDIFFASSAVIVRDGTQVVFAQNQLARDLHERTESFELEILQYITASAQIIADRYAFALGDRRAYYEYTLGPGFLDRANFGASFQVIRKQLPGYELDQDVERERQTNIVEVTKQAHGVTLILEDQKAIQDNLGDW